MSKHEMNGAELASQMKGRLNNNMKFCGLRGVDDPSLHLSEEDIKWWRDAKFGLFIHWGVYSVIGKGEWVYFNEKYDESEYRRIAEKEFCPNRSAREITDEWIQTALEAGMKYAVMVTRHHDGYALWDSDNSWKDFTSVKCGPGEDYVKAFTDSCHENNMYTGLYYSPMDWRFPGYFDPYGKPESAAEMKKQGYRQIEELCTKYGQVDIIWYDGGWLAHEGGDEDAAWFWEPIKLNQMVRSFNPKMMVTPRSGYKGDFECDEGSEEVKGGIVPIPWEKNMSISSAWGYRENDNFWDFESLLVMLVNTICRDGNLLLNVGPDRNGRFPEEAERTLRRMGRWLTENGEAVYGTRAGRWEPVDRVYGSTQRENITYIHVLDPQIFNQLKLTLWDEKVESARLLDGTAIEYEQLADHIRFMIPPDIVAEKRKDTIIKVEFEEVF